jgi:hypothetical protein
MGKIWIMILGYNRPEVVISAANRAMEQNELSKFLPGIEYEYCMVDPGYPMPNKYFNSSRLLEHCIKKDITYLKPYKNLGVGGNWNWFINEVQAKEQDVVIGIDPDNFPTHANYIKAIADVLMADRSVFYCGLQRLPFYESFSRLNYVIGGHEIYQYIDLVSWSAGGFGVGAVKKMGGIQQSHKIYGGIEQRMIEIGKTMGLKSVLLKHYENTHTESPDREYQAWKYESATTPMSDDFETWLKGKRMI